MNPSNRLAPPRPGGASPVADSSGRKIVLKQVPPECLIHGKLRDGIAERLQRFQQAAHPRLANLTAVSLVGDQTFLSWEFVEGKSLAEISADLPEEDVYRVLRELIDAVDALHGLGLVHGKLHGGNIIVGNDGVYLTDASPMLFTDPEVDVAAVAQLMAEIFQQRGFIPRAPMGNRIRRPGTAAPTLRSLASQLDGAYLPPSAQRVAAERVKRNNLIWAIVLVLLAIAAAAAVVGYLHRGNPGLLQSDATDVPIPRAMNRCA